MQMHIPVLEDAVLQYLAPQAGDSYLDVTAGYGGHAQRVLERAKSYQDAVLVDRDETAIRHLQDLFAGQEVRIIHNDFVRAAQELVDKDKRFDMILADFGVSSVHLDNSNRGFSFRADAPLDMRMDQSQQLTAADVVNTYSRDELIKILREYGEEYRAPKIVDAIIEARPITTTKQLAETVKTALRVGHQKVHPSTKTFQAIRIAVNDELQQIEEVLPLLVDLLNPRGRLAVISFHSLEDRIVKQYFANKTDMIADEDGSPVELQLLTKKPVTADKDELVSNPRARSAKLRAVAKIKTERS